MGTFLNLTGVLSEIAVFGTLFYCFLKVKEFNPQKETFSHFGSIKTTSKIFNAGLLFYLIFRTIFIFKVIDYFQLWDNLLITSSYITALVSVFLAAIFTVKEFEFIHFLVTRLAVIVSIIFLITLSIDLMNKNFYLGIFNFLIYLSLLAVGIKFLLRKKTNAVYQIYFFIPIVVWDWVMTFLLLRHKI
jgi:hypothetical protein